MDLNRREVLNKGSRLVAATSLIGTSKSWAGANDRIRVAVMGMGGRGGQAMTFAARTKGVEVAAICDPDERRMKTWAAQLQAQTDKPPRTEPDIRRLLDDRTIDAVIITCCNHWHAPAAIFACQAGKHVYVEKPVCHNLFEGRKLVEAARKYQRVVQGGTQRRTSGRMRKAIQLLHAGAIGDVYMARWLITGNRESIGFKEPEPAPSWLHWDLWLGPAPKQTFHANLVHYNWHWFWDFGNGELGNNGSHSMDVARWGLNCGLPVKIHSTGGRFGYKDQAQTPNTQTCTFEYSDGRILCCDIRGVYSGEESGWYFYGADGSMFINGRGEYYVYWKTNRSPDKTRSYSKESDRGEGDSHFAHSENFFEAIRAGKPEMLNAEINETYLSCALCHLGNISYRLGRKLVFDPETEKFPGDAEADKLLTREYRAPFVVPEKV